MSCACGNAARYVDAGGRWLCALCSAAAPALRALDVPEALRLTCALLDRLETLDPAELERLGVLTAAQDLRGLLGRLHDDPPGQQRLPLEAP